MTRQQKTPRQRAEEALATAERHVQRLGTKKADLSVELAEIVRLHDAAVARRDHLATHPDLQQHPTSTTTSTGAPA